MLFFWISHLLVEIVLDDRVLRMTNLNMFKSHIKTVLFRSYLDIFYLYIIIGWLLQNHPVVHRIILN